MKTKNLEKMKQILEFYEKYFEKYECSPSVASVAKEVKLSASTTHSYIRELVQKGKLEELDSRGYKPATTSIESKSCVPQLGSIPCGTPITEEQNIERYLQFPTWFFKTKNPYFCLVANGDSMIGAGISEGDLVLVRQQEDAQEGDIVVALTEDGESTLKRLMFDQYREKIVLHPENPKYHDIYCDSIKVQGVVEKVIKDY